MNGMNKKQTLVGKGNLEGSVLQGVWMAVSGGGHDWVISWGKKRRNVTQVRCEYPDKQMNLVGDPSDHVYTYL